MSSISAISSDAAHVWVGCCWRWVICGCSGYS